MVILSGANVPVETVNFHLWQPCNMRCGFCFATFRDVRGSVLPDGHLPAGQAERIVVELVRAGFQKITFAGGEPLLCPWLGDLVDAAHEAGAVTALVTNGSLLDERRLEELSGLLDWVTISVDSLRPAALQVIGRTTRGRAMSADDYYRLGREVTERGFRLKINTVVTAANWLDDMTDFIRSVHPERWKILQVLPVEGQNSRRVDPFVISPEQFDDFVGRHISVRRDGINLVFEDNEAMRGSYAMVDPAGRFFDAVSPWGYTYSEPILSVGVAKAISQIFISRDKFLARGGRYEQDAAEAGHGALGSRR
jgi:radical S-adenosyl methionine domain-containing protein 2